MAEVYRREGAWKVRALAQGYAGGLAASSRRRTAPRCRPARPARPPRPPAAPGRPGRRRRRPRRRARRPGPPDRDDPRRRLAHDRLVRVVGGLRRAAPRAGPRAARRRPVDADGPGGRRGPRAGPAAPRPARGRGPRPAPRRPGPADRRARRSRAGAAAVAGPVVGARLARAPSRRRAAWAFRLGELALESAPDFRLPMVRMLPLAPALWIETEDGGDVIAARMMAALATRLMVALPRAPRLTRRRHRRPRRCSGTCRRPSRRPPTPATPRGCCRSTSSTSA